jgi:hypothetical protein
MNKWLALVVLLVATTGAFADVADELKQFVGFTIIASMRVAGYQDKDGTSGSDFQGCQFDRVIIFDNNKIMKCTGYHYHYANRPTAIILSDGSSFKMIVGDDIYEMRR